MNQNEIELAIIRLTKACNSLAGAVNAVEEKRKDPEGDADPQAWLDVANGEVKALLELIEGRGNG